MKSGWRAVGLPCGRGRGWLLGEAAVLGFPSPSPGSEPPWVAGTHRVRGLCLRECISGFLLSPPPGAEPSGARVVRAPWARPAGWAGPARLLRESHLGSASEPEQARRSGVRSARGLADLASERGTRFLCTGFSSLVVFQASSFFRCRCCGTGYLQAGALPVVCAS